MNYINYLYTSYIVSSNSSYMDDTNSSELPQNFLGMPDDLFIHSVAAYTAFPDLLRVTSTNKASFQLRKRIFKAHPDLAGRMLDFALKQKGFCLFWQSDTFSQFLKKYGSQGRSPISIRTNTALTIKLLEQISHCFSITSLDLSTIRPCAFSERESLDSIIAGVKILDIGSDASWGATKLPASVTTLTTNSVKPAIITSESTITDLHLFEIRNYADLETIALPNQLENLSLQGCNLSQRALNRLVQIIGKIQKLRIFTTSYDKSLTWPVFSEDVKLQELSMEHMGLEVEFINSIPKLRRLELKHINTPQIELWRQLKLPNTLLHLDLSYSQVSHEFISELHNMCPHLQKLILQGVKAVTKKHLFEMPWGKHLRLLDLRDTEISIEEQTLFSKRRDDIALVVAKKPEAPTMNSLRYAPSDAHDQSTPYKYRTIARL